MEQFHGLLTFLIKFFSLLPCFVAPVEADKLVHLPGEPAGVFCSEITSIWMLSM